MSGFLLPTPGGALFCEGEARGGGDSSKRVNALNTKHRADCGVFGCAQGQKTVVLAVPLFRWEEIPDCIRTTHTIPDYTYVREHKYVYAYICVYICIQTDICACINACSGGGIGLLVVNGGKSNPTRTPETSCSEPCQCRLASTQPRAGDIKASTALCRWAGKA